MAGFIRINFFSLRFCVSGDSYNEREQKMVGDGNEEDVLLKITSGIFGIEFSHIT